MLKYIDIHSHLNLELLEKDKENVLMRMNTEAVGTITIGVDYETSCEALAIAKQYDFVWAGVGMHPADNTTESFDYGKYKILAEDKRVVCIGECGLDYFRTKEEEKEITKERQEKLFHEHIKLALEVDKPLMIHARPSKGTMDAYIDVLDILAEYKKDNPSLMADFHFFVGDIEIAQRVLSFGFTMSFDGPITFSHDYDEVIKSIPLENIMAETDAPFAAPVPHRGKTCEPFMVVEIYKKIAELKGISEETVREQILANVKRVFKIEF